MSTKKWQTLALPVETPRSAELLEQLDLMHGLRGWWGFGLLACLGALLALVSLALPAERALKLLGLVLLSMLALVFLRHARRALALRRRALLEGIPVAGSVIRQHQRFNLFGSTPHTLIRALFWLPEQQQRASGILWQADCARDMPQGAQIVGLWLPESQQIWLPLEIGLQLDTIALEPQELSLPEEPEETP